MKIRVIAPIRNFSLDIDEIKLFNNLKIINGSNFNSKITLSKAFRDQVGSTNIELIKAHFVFYFEGEASDIVDVKKYNTLAKISSSIGSFLSKYCLNLWFIKDNSVYTNQCFVEFIHNRTAGFIHRDLVACDSQDQLNTVEFSQDEMKKNLENTIRIHKLQSAYNYELSEICNNIVHNSSKMIPVAGNFVNYNQDRLFRALLFLDFVRKNGIIITKITFYMALYECLFTSDDHKISKKIRERASAFAGGNNKTRGSYKHLIIKAYNIRSRYIHGDIINLDNKEMLNISKSLDDLTRIILNKIISTPDNQIFTMIDSPENKEQFEVFFDKLVNKTSEDDSKNNQSGFLNKCVINAFTFR